MMRKQKNKLAELRKYMQIGDVMAKNSKICPECGRKMKQQFIGLQHCKCGISWMKNIGYFERTSTMVFGLQRMKIGKNIKQVPVIKRY